MDELTPEEIATIRASMIGLAQSSLIDDFEFQARLGIDRQELLTFAEKWNGEERFDSPANYPAWNTLNKLCHGLTIRPWEWDRSFTVTREEVDRLCKKLLCSGIR